MTQPQQADDADGGFVEAITDFRSLAGMSLLGVGLVGALRRHRRRTDATAAARPGDEAAETEVWLRITADEERARLLTQALRGLAAICAESRIPVPQAYAAAIDVDGVELFLAPAAPEAPAPWSALEDGRRWRLDHLSAPARAATGDLPYPALVSVGRDTSDRDVLINLAAAAGVVSVSGSPSLSGQVVRALAAELATSAWSDRARVIGVDLPSELDAIGSARLVRVAGVDAALRALAGNRATPDQVVSGRRGGDADGVDVVVLGGAVDEADADRLRGVAASAGGSVAVVAASGLPGARWTFRVDDAGSLHVDALGLTVTASRIDARTLSSLGELFGGRTDPTPDPSGPGGGGRPLIPPMLRPVDDGAWATAQARVAVLGPVLVRAPGSIDETRVELATELAAVLAVHPHGVHPNVLGGAVWPRGVTGEVRDATIARVRDWLGADEQGNHRLQQDAQGRLVLGPDVVTDWHVFCSLAGDSRLAAGTPRERDLLLRALRLVRGGPAAGAPAGRYAWLARTGLEQTVPAVVVDAAHRLVELLYNDDPGGAAEAARAGLRLEPGSQVLWRDVLWSESAQWGAESVRTAVEEMTGVLHDLGIEVEAETSAVIEELLPGGPVVAASV